MSLKKAYSKAKSDSYSPSELAKDNKKLMDLIDRVQDGDDGALPHCGRYSMKRPGSHGSLTSPAT